MENPPLGVLMHVAFRHMEQTAWRAVVDAGFDVTLAQGRVFARIDPGGTPLTKLAESAQITKQTAGFLVDQLEARGYIERVSAPYDGRVRLVRITELGDRARAVANAAVSTIEDEWAQRLGADGMAELYRLLAELRPITDPYMEPR